MCRQGSDHPGVGDVRPHVGCFGAGLVPWDNAVLESLFASIKGELLDLQAWPDRAMARRAIVEYIAWYNGIRLQAPWATAALPNSKKTTRSRR